jgi:hypothetical protein
LRVRATPPKDLTYHAWAFGISDSGRKKWTCSSRHHQQVSWEKTSGNGPFTSGQRGAFSATRRISAVRNRYFGSLAVTKLPITVAGTACAAV